MQRKKLEGERLLGKDGVWKGTYRVPSECEKVTVYGGVVWGSVWVCWVMLGVLGVLGVCVGVGVQVKAR